MNEKEINKIGFVKTLSLWYNNWRRGE
jgi:hypothetical protein